jgi:glycine/D-amino acid oxidase-like deaminating enzyme
MAGPTLSETHTAIASELEGRYRARSLWLDGVPESLAPRQSLAADIDCDVVIVGAGFTGLWTAYYLKQLAAELRVVVVEREIAGFGPSGRNGGWVSPGIAGAAKAYGYDRDDELVRRALQETQAAVDEIGRVAAAEGIDCSYRKEGALTVAMTEPQRRRLLSNSARTYERGDIERELSASEVEEFARIPGALAGSFTAHAARVNPGRLVRGLAHACERLGVVIYERTPALDLAPRRVRCAKGTVRADTVLRATESYTTELPGERLSYLPLYSLMIATEPLSQQVWESLGWRDGLLICDVHHLFFYAQRTSDGRIAIGGRGAPYRLRRPIAEENERAEDVFERLRQTLRRHFPAAADAAITHRWGGPLAVPRDWSMSVVFDTERRFGFAGGYSGHGVTASNISGRTLADLVLGRDSELVKLPWVGHEIRGWPPEPIRFAASRAIVELLGKADRHEDRTGKPALQARLVRPFLAPR